MKLKGLIVDGSSEEQEIRTLVAGLRLLKAYGKVADKALQAIASGKPVEMTLPSVTHRSNHKSYKNQYEIRVVPVHTDIDPPPLPNYDAVVGRIKPTSTKQGESFNMVHIIGPALLVYPRGRVCEAVADDDIGSVYAKKKVSWRFRNQSDTKTGVADVNKAIAEAASKVLVKLKSDGHNEVWQSQAKRVHEVLRARCAAKLLLDGHADRIRRLVSSEVIVDDVHAR